MAFSRQLLVFQVSFSFFSSRMRLTLPLLPLALLTGLLTSAGRACGQAHEFGLTPEMVAKLDTSVRVQFKADGNFCRDAKFFGEKFVPKKLRQAGFTEAKVPVMMRWAEEQELPPALQEFMNRQLLGRLMPYYRAYAVRNTALVWIPKAKNQHMPAAMQLVGKYGMLVLPWWRTTTSAITVAGTAPPPALLASVLGGGTASSSSSSSGTTPGGIQYSSADMSEFTKNASNGTIALYYGYGSTISSAYVYELVGSGASGNKAAIADALAQRISSTAPFIGFEQRSGNCAVAESAIRRKAGTSVSVRCQGEYRGQ